MVSSTVAREGPMKKRQKRSIRSGHRVRLLNSVTRHNVPEGREDNRSAVVKVAFGDGQIFLDRGLNGMRWWHSTDLQLCGSQP